MNFMERFAQARAKLAGDSSSAIPVASRTSYTRARPANDPLDYRTKARLRKQRAEVVSATSPDYGNIPGVKIFSEWSTRKECANAGVHRSTEAGICGSTKEGAYSIVLSGVYEDDDDRGDLIIYTGTGGKEQRSGSLLDAIRPNGDVQTADQSWDHVHNKTLIASFETGNPVRVIRSSNCRSQFAPERGYRYDGLYEVTAWRTEKGRSKLKRLPGQPPIPRRPNWKGRESTENVL